MGELRRERPGSFVLHWEGTHSLAGHTRLELGAARTVVAPRNADAGVHIRQVAQAACIVAVEAMDIAAEVEAGLLERELGPKVGEVDGTQEAGVDESTAAVGNDASTQGAREEAGLVRVLGRERGR